MLPRRSEGEESEYPFFESNCSSFDEWKYYDMAGEDYEGPPNEEFVRREGFGGEKDNIEDVVVVDNNLCSSMIQTTISVDFSKTIDLNPHELIWLQKGPLVFDDDQYKEELMPGYDTAIEDVIEEEEGFVGKGRFGGEEDNVEDIVVVANDLCSSMIQTSISVDFSKTIDLNPHELIWLQNGNLVESNILIGKKYQGYIKAKPMDDKFGFKMIK
nr:hypothetical protein [Tanacetum cinerariifolium]